MEREKVTEILSEEEQAVAKSIDTFEKLSGASVYAEFLRELNGINK